MNELALFAGAGGGLLATQHILKFKTVCAVELDWYCRCVLTQRQNDGHINPFPIWDDICTFDGRAWRGRVDLVTGGFPCQAYSTAAHGKNTAKDLWCEMSRIINEVSPIYVFAENVERRAINKACDELESMGYKTKAISLSAKDLGADHIRERHWLLAHANNNGKLLRTINAKARWMPSMEKSIWESYPESSRVSDGDAYRVDRFKATGNAQVPIVAATAFELLRASLEE